MSGINEVDIKNGMDALNSFGTRLTASEGHKAFVKYIKDEIVKMGLEPVSSFKKFNRWTATNSKVVLHIKDGDIDVKVSSEFPYSGETPKEGVTGKLTKGGLCKSKDIVVLEIKDLGKISSKIAFNQRNAFPSDLKLAKYYKGPVAASFVHGLSVPVQAAFGAKACICIWEGMSDEMVEGQYLNFILKYLKMPTVWVNETEGKKVLDALKEKATATVTLEADIEKDAEGESVYAVIEGENKEECVIINTHTDGTNCVEENGAIGMLSMMKYFLENKPKRTLVFAFVCGHFRLASFTHKYSLVDQSTSWWLYTHKELWNGKNGNLKAIAGVTLEHFGCTEWKDVDGKYMKTNDVDIEVVYTGNKVVDEIYYKALEGRTKVRTVTLHPHNFLHFGEGQSLFNVGIPDVALVTAPDYLCVVSDTNEFDKFDYDLMVEQVKTFTKVVELINEKTAKEIGKAQKYSIGLGKI